MTQNDAAWKKIFENLPLLLSEITRNGFVYVSAEDLKSASNKRESPVSLPNRIPMNPALKYSKITNYLFFL